MNITETIQDPVVLTVTPKIKSNRQHFITIRVHEMPAKFGQILLRTDTRLVFCNRKLMRADIFFTRTIKPIYNFVNPDYNAIEIILNY
jgi:hypothetical protein